MALMWHNLPSDDSIVMVLQVHDSIKSWVKEGAEQTWIDLSIWAMTVGVRDFLKRVYNYDLGDVELGIGAKLGTRWGEGNERSFQTTKDGTVYEIVKVSGNKEKVLYSGGGQALGL